MNALRRTDAGFWVVLLLCVLVAWPFISRAGLPQQTDAELHIFRLAELNRLVRGGVWYPRWAPDFYYGYGYPIFNYYAPLTYYLGLLPMLVLGMTAVQGVKFVFVLGMVLAGVGVYGFVRDNWGRNAGILAAALVLFAPYLQFVDPHARGDLAESFSFGLLPLAFWAFDRLRRCPGPGNWLAASLLTAGIILAHNLMALVFFALLLAWSIWWFILGEKPRRGWSFAALLLGVGVAAFFWLPVALEQSAVNLRSVIGSGSHFDFRHHFLDWRTLLGVSHLLDWGATEPDFVFNLGLGPWLLGAVGGGALLARRGLGRRQAAFFAWAGAALLFLMMPASTFLWEIVPGLPFLQFPWRLLGATAIMLAVVGGAGAGAWLGDGGGWRGWFWAAALALVMLPALPLTEIPPWPADFGPTDTRRIAEIELEGRWLGTTSTADFVPATVDVIPLPTEQVVRALLRDEPVDRVNRATLPAGTTVTAAAITPLHTRYTVRGTEPFALRLYQFAFPGWRAQVNGRDATTDVGLPEGFLVVPLPAGNLQVDVFFGPTPARRAASGVTLLSLVLTLAVAGYTSYSERGRRKSSGVSSAWGALRSSFWGMWAMVVVAGIITLAHVGLISPQGWLRLESTDLRALPAQTDARIVYNDEIALIGFDAPQTMQPGQSLRLTLYWHALTVVPQNYQVFVHLLAPDGQVATQSDKLNPGDFPTERWPLDRYVRDEHELVLPEEMPAGNYRLVVGLWLQNEGRRLPVSDAEGRPLGDFALLRMYAIVTDHQ